MLPGSGRVWWALSMDEHGDLVRDATHLAILGVGIDVASLADIIRSKEATGREKDRLVLPVLRRLAEGGA